MLDTLRQDLTFGLRTMLRTPLTTGAAVLSLALGIGASTAMFGALDVWLLRPLPLPEADRLVRVFMANREQGWSMNAFSNRDFTDWRETAEEVELAAYKRTGASLADGDEVRRVEVLVASANLLRVLDLEPRLGRSFLPAEERAGASGAVLLSDAFWHRAFGADPDVLGRPVVLDGEPRTVVGVLPPEASFTEFRSDVWVPLTVGADEPRSGHSLWGLARLPHGTSLARARQELDRVAATVAERDPEHTFPGATVMPLRDAIYGPQFEQGGAVVGAAVLFVLLIACANIANLLLARGARRSGELALRSVLGAGRARIFGQLLTEAALLAALGGIAGVGAAHLALQALRIYVLPADLLADSRLALDGRFLAIAVGLTVVATALFGLLPAIAGARIDLRGRLQEGTAGGGGGGLRRLGRVLVAGEVALALVLLVSTGLLTRSLAALRGTDLGLRSEGLVTFTVTAPTARYATDEEVRAFHGRLVDRVAELPGVAEVAVASHPPVGSYSSALYGVAGQDGEPGDPRHSAQIRWTTWDYPRVLGMRMLAGSWFGPGQDVPDGPPVAVVSRTLAERHWDGPEGALGGQIDLGGRLWRILGVVEDARIMGPASSPPAVLFRPLALSRGRSRAYALDVRGDPAPTVAAVRRTLREMDPTVALYAVETVGDEVRDALGPQVAVRRVLTAVGIVAIFLTLVGVYGVIAHMVSLRTREMGLRLAVGASPGGVLALVLGQAARLTAWGLLFGVGLSLAAGRGLSFVLVGVSPYDPAVLGVVGLVVAGAAVSAALAPALRASRVDPSEALREA